MKQELTQVLQDKGIMLGGLTALVKGLMAIRNKNFSLVIFVTDFALAIIIGYVSWHLVVESNIQEWTKYIFVIFMSGNAFVLVSILFNPNLAKGIFINFIGKAFDISIKEKNGSNKQ